MAKRTFSKTGLKAKPGTFFIVAAIIVLALVISLTGLKVPIPGQTVPVNLNSISQIRFGIDISGGVEAVFKAKDFVGVPTSEQMDSAKSILEVRMDNSGILDREITTDKANGYIIVRFPWKADDKTRDTAAALKELGSTAMLTFKEPDGTIVIEGKDVVSSSVVYLNDSTTGTSEPQVKLVLTDAGSAKFSEATKRLVGQAITIMMDDVIISAPNVNEEIPAGSAAYITNMGTTEAAVALSQKINAGALPFAMESINSRQISATLGRGAMEVMLLAGLVAFALICLFMLLYYRLSGFVACWALLAQIVGILLAISIPQQTLTLQGIAGIILSIGMGVDANVIIAERIKEELKAGSSLPLALGNGFNRALSSVVDGNVTVAIAAIVLMVFGSGSMLSFGYSLLVGVILNGLTGVIASRLMIGSLSQFKFLQNTWLYGARREKANV